MEHGYVHGSPPTYLGSPLSQLGQYVSDNRQDIAGKLGQAAEAMITKAQYTKDVAYWKNACAELSKMLAAALAKG